MTDMPFNQLRLELLPRPGGTQLALRIKPVRAIGGLQINGHAIGGNAVVETHGAALQTLPGAPSAGRAFLVCCLAAIDLCVATLVFMLWTTASER